MARTLSYDERKREERKALDARLVAVMAAVADESARFNAALQNGAVVVMQTAFGPMRITGMDQDMVASGYPAGQSKNSFNTRSLHYGNDDRWAEMLRQAGVERNPDAEPSF